MIIIILDPLSFADMQQQVLYPESIRDHRVLRWKRSLYDQCIIDRDRRHHRDGSRDGCDDRDYRRHNNRDRSRSRDRLDRSRNRSRDRSRDRSDRSRNRSRDRSRDRSDRSRNRSRDRSDRSRPSGKSLHYFTCPQSNEFFL